MSRRFLFIAGCQRSGTTALSRLLNHHPAVAIGIERFKQVKSRDFGPHLFEESRFFDFRDGDTNVMSPRDYERLKEKFATASVIGDKNPRYYKRYRRLAEVFPGCTLLYIVRDIEHVAASWCARAANPNDTWKPENDYRKAVLAWNEANRITARWLRRLRSQIVVVDYNRLFSGDEDYLLALLPRLDIEPLRQLLLAFGAMTGDWNTRVSKPVNLTDEQMQYIADNADLDNYNKVLAASV